MERDKIFTRRSHKNCCKMIEFKLMYFIQHHGHGGQSCRNVLITMSNMEAIVHFCWGKKVFLFKQSPMAWDFSSPVTVLAHFSIHGDSLPKVMFQVMWNINNLIMALLSLQVINALHFSVCCRCGFCYL